ncbi:MAG: hypothetical protein JNL62_17330 [Bryobacterales bacterium]|nr:hypothetical protein [Bryobacterales bacterium]
MKKNLVKMAAMAAVMFAQVAGAQSFTGRMKVDVPFAFQTGKASLTAGTYHVTMSNTMGGSPVIQMENAATGKAIHFVSPGPFRKDLRTEDSSVVFSCVKENCLLQSVRVPNKEYGSGLKHKMTAADRERLYTLDLTPQKGRRAE